MTICASTFSTPSDEGEVTNIHGASVSRPGARMRARITRPARSAPAFLVIAYAIAGMPLSHAGAGAIVGTPPDRTGLRMIADASVSAIEGRVTIRPVRSVERRGIANSEPYRATISVFDTAGRAVASVEADAEGRFRIPVGPGTYILRPQSSGTYPRASEQQVVVRRNAVTQVEITYDSGKR
jgi:hypothetical protein